MFLPLNFIPGSNFISLVLRITKGPFEIENKVELPQMQDIVPAYVSICMSSGNVIALQSL